MSFTLQELVRKYRYLKGIDNECLHYIEFYAVDDLNNSEEIHRQVLCVDNTPPEWHKKLVDEEQMDFTGDNANIGPGTDLDWQSFIPDESRANAVSVRLCGWWDKDTWVELRKDGGTYPIIKNGTSEKINLSGIWFDGWWQFHFEDDVDQVS